MIRILLILLPVILIYLVINWFQKSAPQEIRAQFKKTGWILAIIALLLLVGTGKLNALFAMVGVAIAFVLRSMPVILRHAPQLHRLWMLYVTGKQQQSQGNQQSTHRQRGGRMTRAEALEILGLKPGASEGDIIQAHRKLIARLHPDRGGSDYLAAQINLAKKTLLNS